MNSFRELQNIYEDYRGDTSNYPHKTYYAQQSDVSYRKGELPTASPGQGIKTFTVSSDPYGIEDEDEQLVSKSKILTKINNLLAEAENDIQSAKHLYDLLDYINKM